MSAPFQFVLNRNRYNDATSIRIGRLGLGRYLLAIITIQLFGSKIMCQSESILHKLVADNAMRYFDTSIVNGKNAEYLRYDKTTDSKMALESTAQSYFYFEYHSDVSCTSADTYTMTSGYATNTCLKLYSAKNVATQSMMGICSGNEYQYNFSPFFIKIFVLGNQFQFLFYNDSTCSHAKKSISYGALDTCQAASNNGKSVILKCSPSANTLPVAADSVLVT